jgi:hypothetical protein
MYLIISLSLALSRGLPSRLPNDCDDLSTLYT